MSRRRTTWFLALAAIVLAAVFLLERIRSDRLQLLVAAAALAAMAGVAWQASKRDAVVA